MNNKYKELYNYLLGNKMTSLDENSFYNEYSQNDEKFSKLYSYLQTNKMTSLDPETFKLEYFGTPIIKKKSQVESTESDSEDGSSEPSSTTTTGPSESSTSGRTETFTGYPGKEKNKYDFKESDGVAHWYEPNPKKDKALTELNSMRNAPPKPGPTGQGSMPAFSPEEIKRKELQYNKIPSKKIIEDDARVRALNKHFGKNASLDPIDQVYTNYDEQKKDNEYRVKDNNWQRKVPGAKSWTTVTDERAVNALNRRYGKEVKYKAELKSVKPEPKLKFADVNTSLVSKTEEDAVGTLSKKYGKYGFTFEQSGYGTDYVIAYNKDKTKEITVGFDEANPEEALKLKSFLEQNASKEKSNAALELEKKIKSLNSTHTSPGAKGYDILDRTNTLKYVLSDEYKTKFSSLSFDEMEDQINNYIKTSFQKSEDLDKFWGSDAYKIFKEKKKEEFGAIDERIDLLYTELQSAKSSGNKSDVKNINSKINTYLSEDVIQDQVKNYGIQLNDLDKSAKILASDQKKYSQSVDDFNKLSQSGQMTQEEFDLAKKNLEDQAEKLGTRADFLMSSGKSIQNDQKKLNVVAGKYFTKKEKAGSFGGGIVNSILTGISKSIIEVPSTFVISLTESSGSEYFKLSPEEKQYYKDKGYSKDQTINLLVNNKIKDFKAETRKNLIDVLGADQTTQEYMKSADRGLFAKSIFGVAESAPAMLMGFGGYAASFTGLASQAYSSIEDEMLNDADFETSSVGERAVVAVPYALLMGVLENFGLKNVVKGSSFTGGIVKDILINSMKQMPKDGTKGLLQNIMTKEVKSVLAKGAFKIVNGAIAEFETGATQALVLDIGLKALYNKISQSGMTEEQISNLSGGEMFATPDTLGEITSTVLEDGLAEAIGGAAMSTFTTVVTGLKNGNISLYNEDDLNYLKEISQDTEFKKIIVANLKTEMLKGNLTKSEAQERLDAMNQLSSVIESIPDGLSEKDQISAVNILSEKNRLEKERQGKDPALVTAQTDRINEINEELKNISKNATKEDNIKQQEGTAEGGISEYQGTGEGQQKDGVSEGGQREATVNEADSGDSTVASKVQQEEQVATLRAEEQAELLKAIPKIEKYKVNGKIDKTLMPKTVLAKYNKIYDKYDKLISPLLETTGEVAIDKPVITTNTTAEVERVKSLSFEAEDGATFNIDGTKYEGVGLVVPVDSMNTTTEELTPEMVADFVAERQKMIGDAGVVKAGIYKFPNSNQVSIDLSVVVSETSREQALEFARLAGQESLFDLETFENIKTGATGENPMKFTPEQHREISKALKEGRMPNVFGPTVEQEVEAIGQLLSGTNQEIDQKASTIIPNKRMSRIVARAAKAVSRILPDVKFVVHSDNNSFVSATNEGQSQKIGGIFDPKTNTIHINLVNANARTVSHEVFHAILINKVKTDANAAAITKRMVQAIASKIDNNPELKKKLEKFISNYEENIQNEEKLAELVGMLSENYNSMSASIKDIIARWIDKLANIFGLDPFNRNETYDMLNTIARKVAKGEVISEADVKTISYKKDVELNAEVRKSLSEQDSIKIAKEVVDKTIKGKAIPTWIQKKTSNKVKFVSFSGEINQKNVKENAPSSYNSIAAKLSNYNTFNINVKEELNNSLAGASKESINKALEYNKKKLLPKINSLLKEIVKIKSNKKLTKEEKLSKISIRNEAIVNIKKIAKMKDLNDQLDAVLNIEHKSTKDSLYNSMFYDLSTNLKRLKGLELANKSEDIYKKAKDIVKSNLLSVYNSVSPRIRQISKLWYDGANLIAQDMANSYQLTNEQAAAIIATQSPQMPWFDNLHLADVIMNLMHSESNNIFTKELFDYYVSKSEGYAEQKKYIPTLSKAIGTPLSKLSDLDAAIFIRAYYDTKLSRKAPIRIPTGTAISEDQKGDSSFSGYSVIAKGISIFRDGSIENISNQLGEANKVRNFYMNIADPSDKRAVTIDTHAMAIALFKPLASNDYEVNFDAATFAFYADAYRELADELGIEARALQSITWEAARAIFPAKEKAKSGYKEKISNIWDELVSGNKSLYKVQEEIFNQAQDPNITEWSEYINILKDEKARTNVSGRIVGLEGARATDNMGAVPGTSIGKSKPSGRTGVSSRGAKVTPRKQLIGENANLSQNVRDNLQVARGMENANKDTKTIRIATGWERGAGGKWRYEILDGELKVKVGSFKGNLSDVLENQELFNAYPQLSKLEVDLSLNGLDEGYYDNFNGRIKVNGSKATMLSILLHEVQHAIQYIEGFERGSNMDSVLDLLFDNYKKYNKIKEQKIEEYKGRFYPIDEYGSFLGEGSDTKREAEKEFKNKKEYLGKLASIYDKLIGNKLTKYQAFNLYEKVSGEVEARNVQSRIKMTPEERRQTTLQETEDVSREDQIIFFEEDQAAPRKQLAPNGKPSKLNDVQWEQVRTPAFKKWFGDWENDPKNASKVVDENGEPKVKWRGDNNPKNVFDYINYGGHGVYYFGDVDFAESFGDKLRPYFINCRNPFLPNKTTEKQEKEIRNLLEKDANKILTEIIENNGFNNLYDFLDNYYLIEAGFDENSKPLDILIYQLKNGINYFILEMNPIIEWIKNNDYDGYESYEGNYDNIAVFNSNQIKLADGTNTTFDSAEASIRKQLSPEVSSKLTEDKSGNFVFHHYSNDKRDVIKPGTGQNIITGKEEGGALSAVGGLAMYYTMDNQVEPGVGNVLNTVLVPNGKVYDFNSDPDNFYDEAKKRFEATRPSQSFSPNYQLAFITQIANENGYDMVVAKWRNNELRAQTTMSLEASKDNVSMKPIAEETYKVGDNVEVYGSKGRITSIDGDIITFKGEGVGGQINFKRFPKSISKQITPRKQIAEEVTGIEESISPRKQQPMNINDIVRLTKAQGFSDAAIRQYLKDQGYSDKNINDAMEPDTGDVTVSKIREASKKELLSRQKKMTIIDRIRFIRNKIIDRQSDIKRLIKGIGSKESIRAYNLLVSKAGASGFANYRFKNAEADIYKGLSKNDLDTLEDIIYARRMVAINESRAKKGLEPYTGMDGYSEVKALKDLDAIKNKIGEKKFNDLSKRATIYFGVFSENLKKLYESGRINEETYINLRDIEYSPIKTIKYIIGYNLDAETIDKEASKLGVSKKDILALTDSNENAIIFDSKWLLLLNVMSVEGRAFENKMLNEFSDAIDGATQEQRDAISEFIIDNPIVKQTSTGSIQYKYNQNNVPVGYSIVSFFKNGVKKDLVVKEAYATQLLDIKSLNQGLNLIGTLTGAKILRFFATGGNPLFIIGNTAVDFQNILFFSDVYSKFKLFGGAQLSYDFVRKFLKGVSTSNRKNKIYNEYVEHGGAMDFLSNDGLRALKSLSPKNKILNISQKVLIGYGNIMSYLGEKSELAFRLAVYDKVKGDEISKFKKENGRDPDAKELDDIMYEATRNARETMDFNQGGSWVKAADNMMPYLNASMQGFRRPLEYAKNNPLGFTSSLVQASVMAGSVAALSLAALMRSIEDDDDEEKKKVLDVLESLSDYEKATHHIIFTGKKDKDGEYEYYRIKKLPVLSVISTITEQFTYKYLLSEAGIKYDVDQEVINKSISASTPFTPSDIASRNPLISGLLTYSFNWDSFTGEKIFREPRDKKIAATAEGMYDDKVDQIYKEIAPSLGLSPIRTKAAIEKIVTSENTNPMISIFYASANGFFNKDGYGAEFSDAFSNVFDASARKLKRFTNKDNIRYKEEDKIENQEMIIETDIYKKEQKVYNTIKNTYKDGKELSNGELVDLIKTNFEKKDHEKYVKKYYTYIKNMNIDRSILDILYEDTPEVQALRLYNRYGSELDSEETKILSGVIRKAHMGLSKQALYIYNKKYSNRK